MSTMTDKLQQNVDQITDPDARAYLAEQLERYIDLRRLIDAGEQSIAAGRTHSVDAVEKAIRDRYRQS